MTSPARNRITVDGNEACASVAYRLNEVVAIYPITPASPMAESCDEWAASKRPNLWGQVPQVVEMQSEAGAAGTLHGGLQAGALTTTFTASQGLLLMIPNLYKIAGELTPCVLHVAARTLATHALSIFGDHSDVMSCRGTGFAMLCSASVQEAHDFACVAQAATLESRIPFLHFFDGFRTSHEVAKIEELSDDDLRSQLDPAWIAAHRARALTPDRPVLRGSAQNPDVFFQAREACNPFHDAVPGILEKAFARFAERSGRRYGLVDYHGAPDADRVIVLMGSGTDTVHDTVDHLNARGAKVGVLKVRLYRPFPLRQLLAALPATARRVAVLDRTKEPGAPGDPLYLDVVAALRELPRTPDPLVVAGRYGLSSKEFTPAMVKAVYDELAKPEPRRRFTIGIVDDVTRLSLAHDPEFDLEPDDVSRAVFFGLGSDGTVGANKNSIKIIGEETDRHAQGYFVYDSKKAGAMTVSHLRVSPRPIRSPYLIRRAQFVAVHHASCLERLDVLDSAAPGGTFLVNLPGGPEGAWDRLPREVQQGILDKKLKLYAVDAEAVAKEAGIGRRINTVMQTCWFAISGALPREEAIRHIKGAIEHSYSKKGPEVVRRNNAAVDAALARLHEIPVPARAGSAIVRPPPVPAEAPDFVKRVSAAMIEGKGDLLPVSAFPPDGTWPTGTAKWEKRNLAPEIPAWDEALCIQCNKCAFVCPHSAIRAKIYEPAALSGAPATFKSVDFKSRELPGLKYTIQVAPEDCTGCSLCVVVCPAKDKSNPKHKSIDMVPQAPLREPEHANFEFFLGLPEPDRTAMKADVKTTQFATPLFEFSGACAGCGETPYLKLLSQMFGDRLLVANATGCSSIYGGNLPTTPWTTDRNGRGPAWANSLFEDNAEFGLGLRLGADALRDQARQLAAGAGLSDELAKGLLEADQSTEAGIAAQRERVELLRKVLAKRTDEPSRRLSALADYLVKKSVWLVGGDGWAYDIGFGGLDHVLSLGRDVNILVLDTEVYSNTGGQQSKATPLGAAAKFAAAGKEAPKKDLGLIAMSYGNAYVARVAFGAKDAQTVKAFAEAESYPGPSLIIAYSHCIAHGYDLSQGARQQKLAVDSGIWPIYRYDPRVGATGAPALQLDSGPATVSPMEYLRNETRFWMAERYDPKRFQRLLAAAQRQAAVTGSIYKQLAGIHVDPEAK